MRTTHKLFSYGRLQEHEVQQEILDRKLKGTKDALIGFRKFEEQLMDNYPLIQETKDAEDCVKGILYPVSNLDLFKMDSYKESKYSRKLVTLKSGAKAWTYLPRFH